MNRTLVDFDLTAWRHRMGLTQAAAAAALGLSLNGYRSAEYASQDRPGHPCQKTLALLAQLLEEKKK